VLHRQRWETLWDVEIDCLLSVLTSLHSCLRGCPPHHPPTPLLPTPLFSPQVKLFGQLGVKKGGLALIPPQFEAPLPPLTPATFPPAIREPPPPPLELFDLDELFASEQVGCWGGGGAGERQRKEARGVECMGQWTTTTAGHPADALHSCAAVGTLQPSAGVVS
jgi:hypothetical protein